MKRCSPLASRLILSSALVLAGCAGESDGAAASAPLPSPSVSGPSEQGTWSQTQPGVPVPDGVGTVTPGEPSGVDPGVPAGAGMQTPTTPGAPGGDPAQPVVPGEAPATPGDPVVPSPPVAEAKECGQRSRRIWKLMPNQLAKTADSVLPGLTLATEGLEGTIPHAGHGFSNLADIQVLSGPHVKELSRLAQEFSQQVLEQRASFDQCLDNEEPNAECVADFLSDLTARAFRRPAEPAELNHYVEFFKKEAAAYGALDGLEQVIQAVFLSPSFQFRTELGDGMTGVVEMTPYERASAISFSISDGPPDEELIQAAESGQLSTSEQLAAQVRRLIAEPSKATGITRFLQEHFGVGRAVQQDKDMDVYPQWEPELQAQLVEESMAFFDEVLWGDDGQLKTLLTADYSMVNDRVAEVYGVNGPGGEAFQKAVLPAGQRSGILTQASFISSLGGFAAPDITKRGHFVRAVLMCMDLPPPPDDIPPIPDVVGLTRRQRLETIHREEASCDACHQLIDPIGYALENYDAIGQWRTEELLDGNPIAIDATGSIVGTSQGTVAVNGALELGQTLAGLPEVQGCFMERLAEFLAGGANESDSCRIERAMTKFDAMEGQVLQSVVELLADESFYRRGE